MAFELRVIHELLLHRASVVGNVTVDDGVVVAEDLGSDVAAAHARVSRLLARGLGLDHGGPADAAAARGGELGLRLACQVAAV